MAKFVAVTVLEFFRNEILTAWQPGDKIKVKVIPYSWIPELRNKDHINLEHEEIITSTFRLFGQADGSVKLRQLSSLRPNQLIYICNN